MSTPAARTGGARHPRVGDQPESQPHPPEALRPLRSAQSGSKDSLTDCDDPSCQREGIVVCDGTTPVDVTPAQFDAVGALGVVRLGADLHGVDNDDTDDFVDCDDFSCSANVNVTVCGPSELTNADCVDGISNNDNPFIDCNDFSCKPSNDTPAAPCL